MPLKINDWTYDSENKEYVRISNGYEAGNVFIPTEAVALRIVGMDNGLPVIAYTYRKVKANCLSTTNGGEQFSAISQTHNPVHWKFIGRV